MIQPLRDDLMVQQQLPAGIKPIARRSKQAWFDVFDEQDNVIATLRARDVDQARNMIGAWQHMVAVIMLNQTGRKPVKTVFPIFMHHWPTPLSFYRATEQEVKDVIWPLGMVNVRYKRLKGMTRIS